MSWPVRVKWDVRYNGHKIDYAMGETFTMCVTVGSTNNDMPANTLVCGIASHSAAAACKTGGDACRATTGKYRDALIGKGQSASGKLKKNKKKQSAEQEEGDQEKEVAKPKHGHITWFCHGKDAMRKQTETWNSNVDLKVALVNTQANKTGRRAYSQRSGYREKFTLPWYVTNQLSVVCSFH